MKKKINLLIIIMIANFLWYFVFNSSFFNFWLRLIIAVIVLNLMVLAYQDYNFSCGWFELGGGLFSAVILYFIFVVGKNLSGLIITGSRQQIMNVYALKQEFNSAFIGGLLLIIGGGEELFWRGFFQKNLMQEFGAGLGYVIASLSYGLIHLWTGNIILLLAALTAGLFWGYLFLRTKSLTMVIISHIIWDVLVFIIFPLNF